MMIQRLCWTVGSDDVIINNTDFDRQGSNEGNSRSAVCIIDIADKGACKLCL